MGVLRKRLNDNSTAMKYITVLARKQEQSNGT